MEDGSAYTADRAAALSGVPKSTIHYWTRKGLVVPSVSIERTKLWSYSDLLELRAIDWLRKGKPFHGAEIPSSTMRQIKLALKRLRDLDLGLFEKGRPMVAVTRAGEVIIDALGVPRHDAYGQYLKDFVDVVAPFQGGPDLRIPRPTIRIVPGKLSGAPHVVATRVETEALHSLNLSGYGIGNIRELYPYLSEQSITEAVDLEEQLSRFALAA